MKLEEIKEKIKKTIKTDVNNANEYIAFAFIIGLLVIGTIIAIVMIKNR